MQCDDCVHDALVGGVVLPRRRDCQALEGISGLLGLAVAGLCRSAATRQECPLHELRPAYPDSYLSEDLAPAESVSACATDIAAEAPHKESP